MKLILILFLILLSFNLVAQTEFRISFDLNEDTLEQIRNIRIDNLENNTIVESNKKSRNLFELDLNKVSHLDTVIFVIEAKNHIYSSKIPLDKIKEQDSYSLSITSYRKLLFFRFYNLILSNNKNELQTPFYLNRVKK